MPRTLAATRQIVVRRRDGAALAPHGPSMVCRVAPQPRLQAARHETIGTPLLPDRTTKARGGIPEQHRCVRSTQMARMRKRVKGRQVLKGSQPATPARPSFNRPPPRHRIAVIAVIAARIGVRPNAVSASRTILLQREIPGSLAVLRQWSDATWELVALGLDPATADDAAEASADLLRDATGAASSACRRNRSSAPACLKCREPAAKSPSRQAPLRALNRAGAAAPPASDNQRSRTQGPRRGQHDRCKSYHAAVTTLWQIATRVRARLPLEKAPFGVRPIGLAIPKIEYMTSECTRS